MGHVQVMAGGASSSFGGQVAQTNVLMLGSGWKDSLQEVCYKQNLTYLDQTELTNSGSDDLSGRRMDTAWVKKGGRLAVLKYSSEEEAANEILGKKLADAAGVIMPEIDVWQAPRSDLALCLSSVIGHSPKIFAEFCGLPNNTQQTIDAVSHYLSSYLAFSIWAGGFDLHYGNLIASQSTKNPQSDKIVYAIDNGRLDFHNKLIILDDGDSVWSHIFTNKYPYYLDMKLVRDSVKRIQSVTDTVIESAVKARVDFSSVMKFTARSPYQISSMLRERRDEIKKILQPDNIEKMLDCKPNVPIKKAGLKSRFIAFFYK